MLAGDPHNFGRRVTLRGRFVHKPRTVMWEWLLLSPKSPLRQFLGEPFSFLPSLEIDRKRGIVERIELRPLRGRAGELATIVGRSLALWSWLGVADLHWENMALGVDARGVLVFGPLDIEMIFGNLLLPTETKLLPEADEQYGEELQHAAGVRRAIPHLGGRISAERLLRIVAAYRETLGFLDEKRVQIARIIARVPGVKDAPIRVLLRATGDYTRGDPTWPPLIDAETEQLARGDIPYFFRLWGKRGLRYFRDSKLKRAGFAPVPLEPLLPVTLASPARDYLRDQGMLSVIGAFDHDALTGHHEGHGVALTLGRRIIVDVAGERVACPRNLRRIVGSLVTDTAARGSDRSRRR